MPSSIDSQLILPQECALCPRRCGADRQAGMRGFCGATNTLRVARAALHQWEEPPISGTKGSGTVFFSGCSLHCVYCQNKSISLDNFGKDISVQRLAEIFLELQDKGAHNINLVTPTHYVVQIKAALDYARQQGLVLPIVYNTSGYELPQTIASLEGYIDIYLTDFKYASSELAHRLSHAADYPKFATSALDWMVEQVGPYTLDTQENGEPLLKRGVIVRHLMLPGHLEDSKQIVKQIYERYGDAVCLSLMNQYTPMAHAHAYPELRTTVNEDDYDTLIDYALDLGVTNSFMQEGATATESFIPAFDNEGV